MNINVPATGSARHPPDMPAPPLTYDPSLDGLRAIAMLSVLAFHLDIAALHGGFIGVDIFYVISGYLITRIVGAQIEDGHFKYTDFIVRRARRLMPALLVTIAVTLGGAFLLMSPVHFSGAAQSGAFAAFSLSNWFFWLESDYFATSKHVRPLLHTWSLGVEVQFYLVWPLVLFGVMKSRNAALQIALMAGFAFVSFASAVWAHASIPSATFYLSPFRIWQFAAGGCVAIFAVHYLPRFPAVLRLGALLLGLVLLGASLAVLTSENYRSLSAVLPTVATALLLLGLGTQAARTLLGHRSLAYLGKISYSLYLVHWPIIILYRYWVFRPLGPVEIMICAASSFICAALLYHYVEARFRRPWTNAADTETRTVGVRLVALMGTAALIAGMVPAQQGWDWRLPQKIRAAQAQSGPKAPCHTALSTSGDTGCAFADADPAKDSLMLIGDSHALALGRGMHETSTLTDARATLIVRYGTLPFHGVTTYSGEWTAGDFGATFDRLVKTPPDIVVLHARFDQYWWSQDANTRRPTWLGDDAGSPEAIAPSQAAFMTGLAATITQLASTDAKILVVGAVPYPGLDSGQCLLRPRYVINDRQSDTHCSGYSRAASIERAGKVNQILKDSADAAGFLFVDPMDIFCSEDTPTCIRQHEGRVIYADDNHLNEIGASMLAQKVWDTIETTRHNE